MADPTCPCYVCGTQCQDWGTEYSSVCAACEKEIDVRLGYGTTTYYSGNGFSPKDTNRHPIIMAMKKERDKLKCGSSSDDYLGYPIISAQRSEKPCKQCGRKNDVGVSKCWHCEVSQPTA